MLLLLELDGVACVSWRVDPFMLSTVDYSERKNYVCTLDTIPAHALMLYKYEHCFYTDEIAKYYDLFEESVQTYNLKPYLINNF